VRASQDLADLQLAEMMKSLHKVRNAINADLLWTIDEISEITGLSWSANGIFEYETRFRKIRSPVVERG